MIKMLGEDLTNDAECKDTSLLLGSSGCVASDKLMDTHAPLERKKANKCSKVSKVQMDIHGFLKRFVNKLMMYGRTQLCASLGVRFDCWSIIEVGGF